MVTHFFLDGRPLCNHAGLGFSKTTDWSDVTCQACLRSRYANQHGKREEVFLSRNCERECHEKRQS